jgi:hypothetical protein
MILGIIIFLSSFAIDGFLIIAIINLNARVKELEGKRIIGVMCEQPKEFVSIPIDSFKINGRLRDFDELVEIVKNYEKSKIEVGKRA